MRARLNIRGGGKRTKMTPVQNMDKLSPFRYLHLNVMKERVTKHGKGQIFNCTSMRTLKSKFIIVQVLK